MRSNASAGRKSSVISDEELENIPLGNLKYYGPELAATLQDASLIVSEAIISMGKGRALNKRQFALVSWLLEPITLGERIGRELPYPKKKGRKPAEDKFKVAARKLFLAFETQRCISKGMTTTAAYEAVAGKFGGSLDSVRGNWESLASKMGGAEGLRRYIESIAQTSVKVRNIAHEK